MFIGLFVLVTVPFFGEAKSASVALQSLQNAANRMVANSALFLSQYDIDMKLSGRVRHETFNFTSPLVFRSDYFDRYTFQRAKFNFDLDSTFGKRTYGLSAVDCRVHGFSEDHWENRTPDDTRDA